MNETYLITYRCNTVAVHDSINEMAAWLYTNDTIRQVRAPLQHNLSHLLMTSHLLFEGCNTVTVKVSAPDAAWRYVGTDMQHHLVSAVT